MCSAAMSISGKRKTEIDCLGNANNHSPNSPAIGRSVSLVYLIADFPITFTTECKYLINPVHLMLMFMRRSLLGAVMGDTGPVM